MSNVGRPIGSLTGLYPTQCNGRSVQMYRKWQSMHARCYRQSHPAYPRYGGRGIAVDSAWHGRDGFDRFCADMGTPPHGQTLGRLDHDKPYGPGNCAWQTWKEQAANRRQNGPALNPQSLRQQAIAAGLPYHVVYQRVKLMNWSLDKALSTPVAPRLNSL